MFHQYHLDRESPDLTIIVDGDTFSAHCEFLSAASPKFKELLDAVNNERCMLDILYYSKIKKARIKEGFKIYNYFTHPSHYARRGVGFTMMRSSIEGLWREGELLLKAAEFFKLEDCIRDFLQDQFEKSLCGDSKCHWCCCFWIFGIHNDIGIGDDVQFSKGVYREWENFIMKNRSMKDLKVRFGTFRWIQDHLTD